MIGNNIDFIINKITTIILWLMKYNRINVDQVRAGSSLHTSITAIKRKESSVDEGSNDDVNKLRLPS